jgi:hypothetical protein
MYIENAAGTMIEPSDIRHVGSNAANDFRLFARLPHVVQEKCIQTRYHVVFQTDDFFREDLFGEKNPISCSPCRATESSYEGGVYECA